MKIPEKSQNWKEVFDKEGEKAFKFIREKKLFQKVIDFNKKYYYWEELKYRVDSPEEQKYLWALMKFLRSEKYELVQLPSLELKYVNLPEINKQLHQFDKYLAGNIEIQSRTLGLEKKYIMSSLMEEAIASSILEGAATTRKAAKIMLKEKRKPKTKDEMMIVNGFETMQIISKRRKDRLSPEFLLEIQRSITKGTLKREIDVGKFRDNDEIVVGDSQNAELIYHIPPTHDKINQFMNELCNFANDDSQFIHPIIKGAILHFMIGYIHPFNDGNGRTARSVFYWFVLSRGYWLFEYMALSRRILKSQKDYGLAYLYTESDEMDITYFLKYILVSIEDTLQDLMEYLKVKQGELQEAKILLNNVKEINFRQANILEEIMNNPGKILTIEEVSRTYNIVYQTARSDLLFLTKKEYLTMSKISRKYVFSFTEKNQERLKAINPHN